MEKIPISIYKFKKIDFDILIDIIKTAGYTEQKLNNSNQDNISIFYTRFTASKNWKNFLRETVVIGQPILKDIDQERFIILVKKDANSIYAVVGGGGYFCIKDHVESDFGFKIASCLINKESKVIRSSKEKSVMSKVLGQTKYFRTESTFLENDEFGNFYQELDIVIDKQKLIEDFGFSKEEVKKNSVCVAKNSFKINKSLTFSEMLRIVDKLDFITKNRKLSSFNNVEIVKDKNLIKELNEKLINQLWERCYEDGYIDFDLCESDFESYLKAEKYIVTKGTRTILETENRVDNVDIIFKDNSFLSPTDYLPAKENKEDFKKFIGSIKIETFDANGNDLTSNNLFMHIHADIEIEEPKQRFFLINGEWYLIKNDFLKELGDRCKKIVESYYNSGLNKKWEKDTDGKLVSEDDYNYGYIGENNTLVLHKIVSRNIELCDILKWDQDGNIYFYHVKRGFGNSLRELCSQIFLAAKTLQNEKEFKKEIFTNLKNSNIKYNGVFLKNQLGGNFEELIKIIEKAKKFYFVLSFIDTRSGEYKLISEDSEEIDKFQSNIAKFSLSELFQNIKKLDKTDFLIGQITK